MVFERNGAEPFNSYSGYLKRRFSMPVYRVGVDAGFGCPHLDAGGCSYCDAHAARSAWLRNKNHRDLRSTAMEDRLASIKKQIETGVEFLRRRYGARGFILYFQAGTNTYAPADELRRVYDFALAQGDFRGMAVSTRPDCLSPEALDLLGAYRSTGLELEVELGLQSASDRLLESVNRGHGQRSFIAAWDALRERDIPVIIHLILGLPGETRRDLEETAAFTAGLRPFGVKLHNLHIPRNSRMFQDFLRGEIAVPSAPRHLESLIFLLERLPADTVILRLSSDTPGGPAAPRRFWDKSEIYRTLAGEMARRGTWQGRLC